MKILRLFTFTLLFVAGCSAFPGLRVLTGEDSADSAITQAVEAVDLVMADKTGATDPSLMAAATRIEAAIQDVDIIEIRRDEANDIFLVNMLFPLPSDASLQTQAGRVSYYTSVQRAIELTWQGTLTESEGTSAIQVNFITPRVISTLDSSGSNFYGLVWANYEIERGEAINYLGGSRNLNDFYDLIAVGTLTYASPEADEQLYTGEPNHPLFMLDRLDQVSG